MLIRWDTLLIAVAVTGGSMLIENSHRIDTAAPDDDVMATATDACIAARTAALDGWSRPTLGQSDEGYEVVSDDAAAALPPTPPACSSE